MNVFSNCNLDVCLSFRLKFCDESFVIDDQLSNHLKSESSKDDFIIIFVTYCLNYWNSLLSFYLLK